MDIVSVIIVTYNQQDFIEQTIESVINQKVNFDLEILIGEDKSPDHTLEIVLKLQNKYPHLIKVFSREQNMGLVKNFADLLNRAKGKYIASMGGDDYWTDTYKLQKQYDFLEENIEYSLIGFGALTLVNSDNFLKLNEKISEDKEVMIANLFLSNSFHASEIMYRNIFLSKAVPDIFYDADTEDRQLYMLLGEEGRLLYKPQIIGGVYRQHENSMTQSRSHTQGSDFQIKRYKERIRKNILWNDYFNNQYADLIAEANAKIHAKIFRGYLNLGKFRSAFEMSHIKCSLMHLGKYKVVYLTFRTWLRLFNESKLD